jgi:hypothetical protein
MVSSTLLIAGAIEDTSLPSTGSSPYLISIQVAMYVRLIENVPSKAPTIAFHIEQRVSVPTRAKMILKVTPCKEV